MNSEGRTSQQTPRTSQRRWVVLGLLACSAIALVTREAVRVPAARAPHEPASTRAIAHERATSPGAPLLQRIQASARPMLPATGAPEPAHPSYELEVSGVVIDATGGSVPGAQISAHAGSELLVSARSEEDGAFFALLPAGDFEISARAEGYSVARTRIRTPARDVRLVMAPAASVRGRVVAQATGEPLPGLAVLVEAPDGTSSAPPGMISRADGTFELEALGAGEYQIEALNASWRSPRRPLVIRMGEQLAALLLEAVPAGVLMASVSVEGETCVEGFVRLRGPLWSNTAVQAGKARVEGVIPGLYEASVGCDPALSISETLELGLGVASRRWTLSRGATIAGHVLDGTDVPVAGAQVRVLPASNVDSAVVTCVSDPSGAFECAGLVAGNYSCQVVGDNGSLSEAVDVSLGDHERAERVLRTSLTATLLVSADADAVGRGVFARREGAAAARGTTTADGDVLFEQAPLGAYVVYAGAEGEREPEAARVTLERAAQVVEVRLASPRTTELKGRVLDAEGQPVPDAWVRATGSGAWVELAPVLTDSQGGFAIGGVVSTARYDVSAASGGALATLNAVAPGAALVLRLRPQGSLQLRVVTADGAPANNFEVAYRRRDGAKADAVRRGAGAAGRWSSPPLEPGRWQVMVSAGDHFAGQELTVLHGEPSALDLTLERAANRESIEILGAEQAALVRHAPARTASATTSSTGEDTGESPHPED